MEKYRLVYVAHCSFRYSEESNYDTAVKIFGRKLRKGEVMLLISFSENQVIWVLGGLRYGVLDTRRWRIPYGNSWNPLEIKDYAEKVNIELVGLKKFEEHVKARLGIKE